MALALTQANIAGGSITKWYIQTAAGTTWQDLEYLRNGKVNFETLSTKDSKGRNIPYAVKMTATAQTIATASLTAIIELLDSMVGAEIDSQIELENGQIIDTSKVAPSASEAGAGFSWKYVSDADRSDVAYIEFRAERIVGILEVADGTNGLLDGSLGTLTTTETTSGFGTWEQAVTDIMPAGINTVKCGAGAYDTHHFGIIRNGKFTAEVLTNVDTYGRNISDERIKVNFEAEMMQASSAETQQLEVISALDVDWQLVFANGRTFQADSQLGFDYNFEVGSDRDGISFIKVMGEGVVLKSEWDGCWT